MDVMPAPQFGEILRRIRTDRRLSLTKVATEVGISPATLSRIETNKQNLDVTMLYALAQILAVSPARIVGDGREHDDLDALASRLAMLSASDRAKVFIESSHRRNGGYDLHAAFDDLLSTLQLLRDDAMRVSTEVKRRRRDR